MVEAVFLQPAPKKDWVDFALVWIQVLRKFKEKQENGEIESITYFRLKQDIEYIIDQVTEKLLFDSMFAPYENIGFI